MCYDSKKLHAVRDVNTKWQAEVKVTTKVTNKTVLFGFDTDADGCIVEDWYFREKNPDEVVDSKEKSRKGILLTMTSWKGKIVVNDSKDMAVVFMPFEW